MRLDPFKIPLPLPIGDRLIIRFLLRPEEVKVVLDHVASERLLRKAALLEEIGRLAQRARNAGEMLRGVDIPLEDRWRLDFIFDAVKTGGERGCKGEIRVAVGAGDAALDAKTVSLSDHAESGGPIIITPGKPRRRPGAGLVALVRVDRRRIEDHHLRNVRNPTAEKPAKRFRAGNRSEPLLSRKGALIFLPEAQMNVAARSRLVRGDLRHESDAQLLLFGDLLQALFEDHMPIGHREDVGVADIQLMLPQPPLPFRIFYRDSRLLEMPPRRAVKCLLPGSLQGMIIFQVPAGRLQTGVSFFGGVSVGVSEDVILQLRCGDGAIPQFSGPVDLFS